MTKRAARAAVLAALVGVPARAPAIDPLDVFDPTPRAAELRFEISSDPAVVGAVFSDPVPARYSAASGTGTLVVASEDYRAYLVSRFGEGTEVTVSDYAIAIDLATLQATGTPAASGTVVFHHGGYSFGLQLVSDTTGGFVGGSSLPQLYCTSQQGVDDLCALVPLFCGATCVLVPGAPYDPATGTVNLVGFEHQDGCGETKCLALDVFSPAGDLLLGEVPPAPQGAAQRRCVTAMNRRALALARAQARVALACLDAAGRGRTARLGSPAQERTAQACLTNDVGGTVARRAGDLEGTDVRRCLDPVQLPTYGYTGAEAAASAVGDELPALVGDLFGADLDAAVAAAGGARRAARCQVSILRGARRLVESSWREALRGTARALAGRERLAGQQAGTAQPVGRIGELRAEVLGHLAADRRGRIARAVDALRGAAARCGGPAGPEAIEGLFGGACAGAAAPLDLARCATAAARCRLCRALEGVGGLGLDCDVFDDGAADASCRPADA